MPHPIPKTKEEAVSDIIAQSGLLRPRDLRAQGIAAEHLRRLVQRGKVERVGRGLYRLPDAALTEHHSLVEVNKRVPGGVICLVSALAFHGLTTQMPYDVWLMIERRSRAPKMDWPPLRLFRASGESFTAGVEEHQVEGVTVRVTSPAKTVADGFKYRNKMGLEVTVEALRECLREKRFSHDTLHHFARICGVENVMRPYLEALS